MIEVQEGGVAQLVEIVLGHGEVIAQLHMVVVEAFVNTDECIGLLCPVAKIQPGCLLPWCEVWLCEIHSAATEPEGSVETCKQVLPGLDVDDAALS